MKQGMPQGMPTAPWLFPPRASQAVPVPSDQSLGHAGSPGPVSWQGAGYRQVCVGTNPSDSGCTWCYKGDSLPCCLIILASQAASGSSACTQTHPLFTHPTPLPPCSAVVLGSQHGRCFGTARSLISNCFLAPLCMWAPGGGLRKQGRDAQQEKVFRDGGRMREARRGEKK